MKVKKLFIFLLLLLHSVLYSQPASTVQSNLTSIEDFAMNIELSSIEQQMKLNFLEEQLKNAEASQKASENSVIEMSNQVETLLKSQKNLEAKCMNLKVALGVSISLSIITTGIMSFVLVNEN